MKRNHLRIFLAAIAVATGALFVTMPQERIIEVPAECPGCLCNFAPTCGDIAYIKKGFPLTTEKRLDLRGYVTDERYNSKRMLTNAALNFIIGFCGFLTISYLLAAKYAHNRH